MKVIKKELSRDLTNLEIVPLADLHIGDPNCDISLIKDKIEYIKSNENVYTILNGDLINNSTKNSVGDVYSEALSPMDQIKLLVELLEPIKDKIIAITSGNHELRSYRSEGVDITKLVCKQLGIEENYAPESAIIFLRFGHKTNGMKETNGSGKARMLCYSIYVTHGSGGGRKEGSKVNKLVDIAGIIDADIYIHSHTHLPMILKESFYRTDPRNSAIAIVPKLFINTSAYLNYGGYGEAQSYKPSSIDTPHIFLSGTSKKCVAKL